jgi:hypothetical protein
MYGREGNTEGQGYNRQGNFTLTAEGANLVENLHGYSPYSFLV